jgi:3-hydroxyisobutyrate dehydrogenase-like beta-hydroxyacid dehydrogenase
MSAESSSPPSPADFSVAFIGLGVMGYPMAGHLARAGHPVTVYNRSAAKLERWCAEHRGNRAATPAQAARRAHAVFTCVGNDDDLRAVVLGPDGAFAGMSAETVLVDHTTASAHVAHQLHAKARSLGLHFVDAPVSGGQAGAEKGQLTVMCGGDLHPFDRVAPVIRAYARAVTRIGPSGTGQLAKMVNQLCIAGLLQGLAEGIEFGQRSHLDMELVLKVISQGAAQSWQMENRGSTMVQDRFDFGFAVDWMRKDLGLCLDEARRIGCTLPMAALVDQFYAEIQAMGGGRWDTSSLLRRLRRPRS